MSLKLWLPLNGDYTNNGLSDVEMQCSTPSWSDAGKIGKCASFNGAIANVIYNPSTEFNYTDNFSFSLWMYHLVSSNAYNFAFTVGRADMGSWGYGVNSVSSTQIRIYFGGHNALVNCSANTWHHVAATIGNNQFKVYIDGALVSTTTITVRPTYTEGNGLGIGTFHYKAGDIYPFYGKINDFRIYDHCLSPKEVKEIAKGLMLHYPLDNCGLGCKNYIKDSYYIMPSICAWGNSTYSRSQVEINDERYKGIFWKFNRGATDNGDFRIGWGESSIQVDPNLYNDKPLQFSIWVKSTTGTQLTISTARMSDQDYATSGSFTVIANQWTKIVCSRTFLSSSSVADVDLLEIYFNISVNTDLIVAQAKLEIADEATPWCPNEADELYSDWGLDENIEYDVSGYENNGEKIGALDYESSSPRYQSSSYFNGTDACVKVPGLTLDMTDITFSMWYKPSGAINFGRIFDFSAGSDGNATTFLIAHYGTNMQLCVHGRYPNGNSIFLTTDTLYPIVAGTWYHVVCAISGTTCKWYIDGKLVMTKILTQSLGVVNFINNYLAESTWAIDPLNKCNISDFRIYATCLSDSDIQELYNKPISIDNQGVMFAVEAVEESATGPQFFKTGTVEATAINALPLYDMETKVLDDGSAWARILHHNNRAGTVLFTTSNVLDIQTTDLYSRLKILEQFRDDNGAFEFMAIQPDISDTIYRWKQTNNPTQSGSLSGYVNIENSSGGLVYGPTDYALMSESGTTTNWWCAVGAKQPFNGGIPGFGRNTVTGTLDFYVRIDTVSPNKEFKLYNKYIECNDIIEC